MERTETQVLERCLKILTRLIASREVRVSELYTLFERKVSRRTLERDLQRLSAANVPLIDRPGSGNERIWMLQEPLKSAVPSLLGAEEITAVLLLDELSKTVQHTPFANGVKRLQERLRTSLPVDAIQQWHDRDHSTFLLLQNGSIDYRTHTTKIDTFLTAISKTQRVLIKYRKPASEKASTMTLNPYLVLLFAEALYAVAFSERHQKFLTLPFHRMLSLELLEERFKRDPDFRSDSLLANRIGLIGGPEHKPEQIELKFTLPVSDTIRERIWHPSQTISDEGNGAIILRFQVAVTKELVAWVLRWQRFCEVLAPTSLREQVIDALDATRTIYRK